MTLAGIKPNPKKLETPESIKGHHFKFRKFFFICEDMLFDDRLSANLLSSNKMPAMIVVRLSTLLSRYADYVTQVSEFFDIYDHEPEVLKQHIDDEIKREHDLFLQANINFIIARLKYMLDFIKLIPKDDAQKQNILITLQRLSYSPVTDSFRHSPNIKSFLIP